MPISLLDTPFFKIQYNPIFSSQLRLDFPRDLFPVDLTVKISKELQSSSRLATCPPHLNLLDTIVVNTVVERYKL